MVAVCFFSYVATNIGIKVVVTSFAKKQGIFDVFNTELVIVASTAQFDG